MTQSTYGFKIDLLILKHQHPFNRICGVMVSVFDLIEVDRGLELRSGQTKDYEICIYSFSVRHAALRNNSKHWLSQNQNNVSEWSDISNRGLLFQ